MKTSLFYHYSLSGSIKNLKPEVKNKSVFISLAECFLRYCIDAGYKVCESSDLRVLEEYNGDFTGKMFKSISFSPTPEEEWATLHFVRNSFHRNISNF